MIRPDDKLKLELMIDGATLRDVVAALAEICAEKAEHIRASYQDDLTARPWSRAAARLETTAAHPWIVQL